jgi:tripartite-type tricarboxylate transporter receptor subunit TctC
MDRLRRGGAGLPISSKVSKFTYARAGHPNMRHMLRLARSLIVLAGVLVASAVPAASADYPRQPVRVLVGLAAGGGTDVVARALAEWLSQYFGQQFVVENRTGMGGSLAAQALINAPPDGYTLLFMGPNNAIATSLYKKLPFDFLRDTVPIAGVMRLTNLMLIPRHRCRRRPFRSSSITPRPIPERS